MGLYDRDYMGNNRRGASSPLMFGNSAVITLVVWNVIIYFIQIMFLEGDAQGNKGIAREWLYNQPGFTYKIWTFVTCGFLHSPRTFGHLFGNMLALFFLGRFVEGDLGSKRFLYFYFSALIFSSVFSVFYHTFYYSFSHKDN